MNIFAATQNGVAASHDAIGEWREDELLTIAGIIDIEFTEKHSTGLEEDMFVVPILKDCAGRVLEMYRERGEVSIDIVIQNMRDRGLYTKMEMDDLAIEVWNRCDSTKATARKFAVEDIRNRHSTKVLQGKIATLTKAAEDPNAKHGELMAGLREAIGAGGANTTAAEARITLTDVLETDISEQSRTIIKTGFYFFDENMPGGGLTPGMTLAGSAPPGEGKTTFCTQLTLGALESNPGLHAVFATAEMSPESLSHRMLAYASGLPTDILKSPITIEQHEAKRRGYEGLRGIGDRLHFIADRITPDTIEAEIIRTGSRWGVIDYIQLIQPSRDAGNRRDNVDSVLRDLVAMARRRKAVLFIVSNQPKPPGGQSKHTNMYGAFKESSEIPHAVDCAFSLERGEDGEVLDENRVTPVFVKFHCWKMRNGHPRSFMMEFDRACQTFRGVSP